MRFGVINTLPKGNGGSAVLAAAGHDFFGFDSAVPYYPSTRRPARWVHRPPGAFEVLAEVPIQFAQAQFDAGAQGDEKNIESGVRDPDERFR